MCLGRYSFKDGYTECLFTEILCFLMGVEEDVDAIFVFGMEAVFDCVGFGSNSDLAPKREKVTSNRSVPFGRSARRSLRILTGVNSAAFGTWAVSCNCDDFRARNWSNAIS